MTADERRIAMNRLSLRIVRETGGQAACDRLEAQYQALAAGMEPIPEPEPPPEPSYVETLLGLLQ